MTGMSGMTGAMVMDLLASAGRLATPLTLAAMGGLLCERSGVINIALEGMMLVGSFAAAAAAHSLGALAGFGPYLALLAGAGAGLTFAGIYALLVLPLRANQVVAGTGINLLAVGVAPFAAKVLYDVTGSSPGLAMEERFALAPAVIAAVVPVILALWLRFTRTGLWLQVAGEHPEALVAAGVSLGKVRWSAVLLGGALAGMGGASLSIFLASAYSRNMTAGRGFMALAALVLGKWRPIPAALACLLFGVAEAAQIRLQGAELVQGVKVPVELIQILPYVVTLVVLAGFVGRATAPKALGR